MDAIKINVLLPNGDVQLCCMDYGLEHKIGNLLTMSYNDLFTSDEYRRIESGLEDDSIDILCRTCKEAVYA
jgi:radical SAM protein with 4Fe4S-binding SPASM domain